MTVKRKVRSSGRQARGFSERQLTQHFGLYGLRQDANGSVRKIAAIPTTKDEVELLLREYTELRREATPTMASTSTSSTSRTSDRSRARRGPRTTCALRSKRPSGRYRTGRPTSRPAGPRRPTDGFF
jgi:hypothetical protein